MKLTREENEMLEGKYGYPVQKSMELLVGLGECYDAERMIQVKSAHLLYPSGRKGASLFVQELADRGGKFVIFADSNPIGEQLLLTNNFARMGLFLSNTCTPYHVGHSPRLGEHVAWSESSAVPFANSVLGARTNKEGGFTSLAAALTGRVPEFGLHLDQNRYGDLEISVTANLNGIADYGALGYFIGKVAESEVPVLTGIPPSVSSDELKHLGSAADFTGAVALYHIVGVTPEAPTKEAAFGPKKTKDWQRFEFGEKELQKSEQLLSNATAREVDIVIFGCPHTSIIEIEEIARLIAGKKLKSGVELWVFTSQMVKSYAERMEYVNIIEAAGGKVFCDTCPGAIQNEFIEQHGHKTVATNAAKWADHMPERHMLSHYGSTERCVEAATTGIWR